MLKLAHFRFLNPEWFRKPQSKLELTLRIPLIAKEMFLIAFTRVIPIITVSILLTKLLISTSLLSLISGVFAYLLFEFWTLEHWYRKKLLPKQKTNIDIINKMEISDANKDLVNEIEKAAKLSARGIVRIAYVGLASWGWEILFKYIYPYNRPK